MEVLIVCHRYPPSHSAGTEVYAAQLARELRLGGHVPTIFTAEKDVARPDLSLHEREHEGVPVFELVNNLFHEDFQRTWSNGEVEDQFGRVLDRVRPDVVHVQHLMYLSADCVEVARRRHIPVVMTLHDFWLQCPRFGQRVHADGSLCERIEHDRCGTCLARFKDRQTDLQRRAGRAVAAVRGSLGIDLTRLARRFERWLGLTRTEPATPDVDLAEQRAGEARERDRVLRERVVPGVSRFLAPSRFLLERFVEWGVPTERLRHVPTGTFGARSEPPPARKERDLRVAYLGTLAAHKGAHVLLEAWEGLPAELRARASLDLWGPPAGDLDYVEGLKAAAQRSGAHLRGHLEHEVVLRELERADLLVVPSVWFENAPLVILEALAVRTPVLVSNLGGAAEMVREGETGFLFQVGDPSDLRRRLAELLGEPALLERVAARAPMPAPFGDTVRATLAIYREVVDEGPRPRPRERSPVVEGLGT